MLTKRAVDPDDVAFELSPFRASCSAISRFFNTSEVIVVPAISAAPSIADMNMRYSGEVVRDVVIYVTNCESDKA